MGVNLSSSAALTAATARQRTFLVRVQAKPVIWHSHR
jgi:hypothetical protein